MKTAISLPDETFERASRRAKELGMSRSELFARAAESYLDALDARSVTAEINSALDRVGDLDQSSVDAVEAGRRHLNDPDERW